METVQKEFIKITPALAQSMLLKNTYKGQRNFKQPVVEQYKQDLINDQFMPSSFVFARLGDEVVIIDGQHRLMASVETNLPIEGIKIVVKCEDAFEVASLWKKYDGGAIRSLKDMAESEVGMLDLDWKAGISSIVVGAIAILEGKTKLHKSKKAALIRDYVDEGNFVNEMLGSKSKKYAHIRKQIVAAAVIKSFQKDPDDAERFWTKVKTGIMLEERDPRRVLREFLLNISAIDRGTLVDKNNSKVMPTIEVYQKCARAWNKFRQGKEVAHLKVYPSKEFPEMI